MRFYTNVQMVGDNFLVRGYENGKHFAIREKFYPTLFVPSKKKTKWAKLFLAENQIKINNKDRKISCVSGDSKSATISSGADRTSAKFSFKSNQGKKKKFIGVVVK